MVEPRIVRNGQDRLFISAGDKNSTVYYTTDGTEPNKSSLRYTGPVSFAQKGTIKAICHDETMDRWSPITTLELDIPVAEYVIEDPKMASLLDGSGHSLYTPANGAREVTLELKGAKNIAGLRYLPNQQRWADGHISRYEIYVDDKKVAEGEFSNIKHNPIEQVVRFSPVNGKKIRLVATGITQNPPLRIGELSVITE